MPAEIIIVDDDPLVAALSNSCLKDLGFTTHWIRDSSLVLENLRKHRPKLLLLDILMPGIDGLSLLHAIKQDPALCKTRVAIVSGKSFKAEIDRAREYGADLFISKPYDITMFSHQILDLIGPPKDDPKISASSKQTGPTTAAGTAKKTATRSLTEPEPAVRLRVWGTAQTDSTPCLSVEVLDQLIILDAGKGIIPLGETILQEGKYRKAWLLLSHFHPDHISGLGLFPCLRREGFELHIAGPSEPTKGIADVLREIIEQSFKTQPTPVAAKLKLHTLRESAYELQPGIRISPFYANHPSTTLGFLMELAGRRITYCPDSEIHGESATALQDYDDRVGRITREAELLIHDARYNDEDYPTHKNEGHSSLSNTVEFAAENEIGRLLLFHSDPKYTSNDLHTMEEKASTLLDKKGALIPCTAARDGLNLEI